MSPAGCTPERHDDAAGDHDRRAKHHGREKDPLSLPVRKYLLTTTSDSEENYSNSLVAATT